MKYAPKHEFDMYKKSVPIDNKPLSSPQKLGAEEKAHRNKKTKQILVQEKHLSNLEKQNKKQDFSDVSDVENIRAARKLF